MLVRKSVGAGDGVEGLAEVVGKGSAVMLTPLLCQDRRRPPGGGQPVRYGLGGCHV
jgi:hypothetical protein